MTERGAGARPGRFHRGEPHKGSLSSRLNWLRAGVLGANDGIVSIAGLVVGVAAATTSTSAVATAGAAGIAAGAVSMALGEYVSVSAQRDTERALVSKERRELAEMPDIERRELVGLLEARGLSLATSQRVADELTAGDPLGAHLEFELGLRQGELANPWAAAVSSAVSFCAGALLPFVAILVPPATVRIPIAFAAVLVALALTGALSAHLGDAPKARAVIRLVGGGALAMVITYGVGELLDVAVN
jgi:VIT1/CCC1 family predicted Fe2+/Mn2+ transporter